VRLSPIDGSDHVSHPEPGKTVTQSKRWSDNVLVMHWEFQDQKTRYISDINTTLSDDRQTLIMSEYYREPGLERIRDWVFERQ